jgi:hypothetical protein
VCVVRAGMLLCPSSQRHSVSRRAFLRSPLSLSTCIVCGRCRTARSTRVSSHRLRDRATPLLVATAGLWQRRRHLEHPPTVRSLLTRVSWS